MKDRNLKLMLLYACGFALAVLVTLIVQAIVKPLQTIPPALQSGTNHYFLALEQVPGLSSSRPSPFLTADPFRVKPKAKHHLLLKENLELARLLAVKAFLWGVIYYSEGTFDHFNTVSPYRLILGEAALGEIEVDVKQFMDAVAISCPIWASLPCADGAGAYTVPEYGNQSAKPIEDLWRNYRMILEAEQSLLSLVPFE